MELTVLLLLLKPNWDTAVLKVCNKREENATENVVSKMILIHYKITKLCFGSYIKMNKTITGGST